MRILPDYISEKPISARNHPCLSGVDGEGVGESSVEYGQYNVPSPPQKSDIYNISGSGESYLVKGTITNTANIPVQGVRF